jgi:hypothetical protein
MPHYLFAVLFEKVLALRRLSQGRHGLRGTADQLWNMWWNGH